MQICGILKLYSNLLVILNKLDWNSEMLPDLQSVIYDIDGDSSDLSLEQRHELRQSLQQVVEMDTSERLQRGMASANTPINRNKESPAVRNIKVLMKFTGQGLLEVA
jgi:hypothetical protein